MRRLLVTALCLGLLTAASSARADDEGAESLIAKGVALREKGRDEEALTLFRKAHEKSPSPRARAQIALAEQALGMWVAAESDLVAALAAESDAWIAKNRSALEGALAIVRRHVGGLEVRGADGADVLIDGARIGSASGNVSFRVEAGTRNLEVRAQGFHATKRSIDVPPGGVARETVALVALSPQEAAAPSARRSDEPSDASGRDEDRGRTQRVVGWVGVATGGVALATGGAALLVRAAVVDDYNADPSCPGVGDANQPPACAELIESQRTWRTVSVVSLIAGGVLAIGGVLLLATAPSSSGSSSGSSDRVAVRCSFGGCVGTF